METPQTVAKWKVRVRELTLVVIMLIVDLIIQDLCGVLTPPFDLPKLSQREISGFLNLSEVYASPCPSKCCSNLLQKFLALQTNSEICPCQISRDMISIRSHEGELSVGLSPFLFWWKSFLGSWCRSGDDKMSASGPLA